MSEAIAWAAAIQNATQTLPHSRHSGQGTPSTAACCPSIQSAHLLNHVFLAAGAHKGAIPVPCLALAAAAAAALAPGLEHRRLAFAAAGTVGQRLRLDGGRGESNCWSSGWQLRGGCACCAVHQKLAHQTRPSCWLQHFSAIPPHPGRHPPAAGSGPQFGACWPPAPPVPEPALPAAPHVPPATRPGQPQGRAAPASSPPPPAHSRWHDRDGMLTHTAAL